jgi:CRISPR/Cas system-associated exonuclease Cas4 (RecB family)
MASSDKKVQMTNIVCSAGKGVMTTHACLVCALSGQNRCGYSYTLLKSIYADNYREGIHVSDIVGCLRKAWYNRVQLETPTAPHERLALTLGTAVHEYMEHTDENVVSEMPLNSWGVVGTADLYYPKTGLLMDIKTTRWLTPSKLPYGSHATQLNIYGAMLKHMGYLVERLQVQYIDMSGPTKCRKCKLPVIMAQDGVIECPKCGKDFPDGHLGAVIFDVEMEPYDDVVKMIIERRDILLNQIDLAGHEPGSRALEEIGPETEESWLCNYCPWMDICLN